MQSKQLLLTICLLLFAVVAYPQKSSREYKAFSRVASQANVSFNIPDGFKQLPAKRGSLPYDFGMNIPGEGFEIWLKVIPQKYTDENLRDSTQNDLGKIEAHELAGEENFFMRDMSQSVLEDYNADTGRTYLINLPDNGNTRHYKYALLIALQKKNEGTILAICFTNDKGPDFFRNIIKARGCIKFKAP